MSFEPEPSVPEPVNAEFKGFTNSTDALIEVHRLACEIMNTMKLEHIPQVVSYFRDVQAWFTKQYDRLERGENEKFNPELIGLGYPNLQRGILAWVIAQMVSGKLNETYSGAMALPEAAANVWMDQAERTPTVTDDAWYCDACKCLWPYPDRTKPYPCLLCGGRIFWHQHHPEAKRDEYNREIFSHHRAMEYLGMIAHQGFFDFVELDGNQGTKPPRSRGA